MIHICAENYSSGTSVLTVLCSKVFFGLSDFRKSRTFPGPTLVFSETKFLSEIPKKNTLWNLFFGVFTFFGGILRQVNTGSDNFSESPQKFRTGEHPIRLCPFNCRNLSGTTIIIYSIFFKDNMSSSEDDETISFLQKQTKHVRPDTKI